MTSFFFQKSFVIRLICNNSAASPGYKHYGCIKVFSPKSAIVAVAYIFNTPEVLRCFFRGKVSVNLFSFTAYKNQEDGEINPFFHYSSFAAPKVMKKNCKSLKIVNMVSLPPPLILPKGEKKGVSLPFIIKLL